MPLVFPSGLTVPAFPRLSPCSCRAGAARGGCRLVRGVPVYMGLHVSLVGVVGAVLRRSGFLWGYALV